MLMDDHQLSTSQNKHYIQLAYGIFFHIVHIFNISFDEFKNIDNDNNWW